MEGKMDGVSDLPRILFRIARDPVGSIKEPSRLTWSAAFSLQIGAALASGAITALIEKSPLDFIIALFVFPIITLMTSATFTLFIYYYFSLFTKTYLDMRRLYSLIVIAMTPYFLIHTLSGFLPPLDLIGFSLMAILIGVGLVEQFRLDHKVILKLISVTFCLFFLIWSLVHYLKS